MEPHEGVRLRKGQVDKLHPCSQFAQLDFLLLTRVRIVIVLRKYNLNEIDTPACSVPDADEYRYIIWAWSLYYITPVEYLVVLVTDDVEPVRLARRRALNANLNRFQLPVVLADAESIGPRIMLHHVPSK